MTNVETGRILSLMKRYFPNGQFHPNCANLYCTQPVAKRSTRKNGRLDYKPFCHSCLGAAAGKQNYKPRIQPIKKTYCENNDGSLGFGYKCSSRNLKSYQLDIDHINGNKENNHHTNIQTICSNCHREKSQKENDCSAWKYVRQDSNHVIQAA